MCSHESITWTITNNSVMDRMLENSLIHKFRPSRKIRKRTKLLNTEIKKHCHSNDCIHLKAQSSEQSLSPQLDSQIDSTSNIMKSGNKYVKQNHEDFDAIDNKLSSEDNTISNKTKPVSKRKVQNKKDQSATINESNIELDSHGLHYDSSLPQSTIIESSINKKNYNNAYINYKPKLLKDVKRNLIIVLKKVDFMHNSKDITDKNIGVELSYDQLLLDIANFDRHHSTPLKKIQTNVSNKDLSDVLQNQQKDSGIDEDSQDKLVKIEKSNKTPMNQNMEKNTKKILISSFELKKTDEVLEIMKDSEEIYNLMTF
ncbi:PREDICTED: uncharacterized protein LOC105620909 [Atta cephalotes]|uniref:Uncharacterized protein n=1 Tax=Atta cephalotes TaxID=12957 RepID=A0A158NJR9_ATTCE|nr:PREDICTED: uncharacterized protein LOC105620909 [Atta cephalotes]